MKISSEFSKYASDYSVYNIIQNKVIDKLLLGLSTSSKNILDLGCGSGAVCKKLDGNFNNFTGVDFAKGMLELHPKAENIESIYGDFNDKVLFENLLTYHYDMLISSSALQWSEDLGDVFNSIKNLNIPIALSIFTSGTFKELNKTASLEPMLSSAKEIKSLAKRCFNADYELIKYKLEFESTREMFRYIKKSGVSGSRNLLSYKQTKKLMKDYPLNYLEFEVIFITSR